MSELDRPPSFRQMFRTLDEIEIVGLDPESATYDRARRLDGLPAIE